MDAIFPPVVIEGFKAIVMKGKILTLEGKWFSCEGLFSIKEQHPGVGLLHMHRIDCPWAFLVYAITWVDLVFYSWRVQWAFSSEKIYSWVMCFRSPNSQISTLIRWNNLIFSPPVLPSTLPSFFPFFPPSILISFFFLFSFKVGALKNNDYSWRIVFRKNKIVKVISIKTPIQGSNPHW